jgi:hypothetical protein
LNLEKHLKLAMRQSHLWWNGLRLEKQLKLERRHPQPQMWPSKLETTHSELERNHSQLRRWPSRHKTKHWKLRRNVFELQKKQLKLERRRLKGPCQMRRPSKQDGTHLKPETKHSQMQSLPSKLAKLEKHMKLVRKRPQLQKWPSKLAKIEKHLKLAMRHPQLQR